MAELDLNAIQAAVNTEVTKMSDEDVRKALLELRVREKTTQKKQYGSDAAKRSAAKQREKARALKARAKALGIYDSIDAEAEDKAQAKFEEWQAEQGQGTDEEETA